MRTNKRIRIRIRIRIRTKVRTRTIPTTTTIEPPPPPLRARAPRHSRGACILTGKPSAKNIIPPLPNSLRLEGTPSDKTRITSYLPVSRESFLGLGLPFTPRPRLQQREDEGKRGEGGRTHLFFFAFFLSYVLRIRVCWLLVSVEIREGRC